MKIEKFNILKIELLNAIAAFKIAGESKARILREVGKFEVDDLTDRQLKELMVYEEELRMYTNILDE